MNHMIGFNLARQIASDVGCTFTTDWVRPDPNQLGQIPYGVFMRGDVEVGRTMLERFDPNGGYDCMSMNAVTRILEIQKCA